MSDGSEATGSIDRASVSLKFLVGLSSASVGVIGVVCWVLALYVGSAMKDATDPVVKELTEVKSEINVMRHVVERASAIGDSNRSLISGIREWKEGVTMQIELLRSSMVDMEKRLRDIEVKVK